MAKNLNKKRMQYSWLSVMICILVIIFSRPLFPYDMPFHEVMEFVGYFLVALCALGRVYCSAFLGGFKNKKLVTYGPFSVVRNPLYSFSLMGILGLSLVSGHLLLVAFLFTFFMVMYHYLIRREEAFLETEFGAEYQAYKSRVPRLLPRFSLYDCPEEITMKPRFVTNAYFDAIWWFVAFPAFEFIEYLQESGFIPGL